MSPRERRRRRHRIRSRTTRKISSTTLAAGGVGLFIGLGTVVYAWVCGERHWLYIGLVYICASLCVLAARQALVAASEARRRRESEAQAQAEEAALRAEQRQP
ncbi:MAG: hypothetical protein K8T26_12715 [Lentisphaerae bacterium]|nr:hypothetical protein [Lentisphaerota bacterium]